MDMKAIALTQYDAARAAIAHCATVDEVKDWVDLGAAREAYARQANDKEMRKAAIDIRMRAKRRLGEIMAAQNATAGKNKGGRPKKTGVFNTPVSLKEAGIDKNLARDSRAAAALTPVEFEAELADRKAEVDLPDVRKAKPGPDEEPGEAPADYSEADHERAQADEHEADFAAMSAIIEADDKLAAALGQVRKANDRTSSIAGLYEEKCRALAQMTAEAKRWMRAAKKSAACPACKEALRGA